MLSTFYCVMAMHPDIQVKAQRELDEVVGPSRLPDFDDLDSLNYTHAIFLECSRWMPVLPLGVPHAAIRDDLYNNSFIPQGTVIIPVSFHKVLFVTDYLIEACSPQNVWYVSC